MSIVLQGSTSGSVTLQEPAVAGTTVLTLPTTSGTVLTSASSVASSQLPTGTVLQVVQAQKTDTFSTSSSSFVDITGLSVSITPTSASNKILVFFVVQIAPSNSGWFGTQAKLLRNSTDIAVGDASGSNPRVTIDASTNVQNSVLILPFTMQWLDSPTTTSSVTYKLQLRNTQSQNTIVNKSTYSGSTEQNSMLASTITVMEIAA